MRSARQHLGEPSSILRRKMSAKKQTPASDAKAVKGTRGTGALCRPGHGLTVRGVAQSTHNRCATNPTSLRSSPSRRQWGLTRSTQRKRSGDDRACAFLGGCFLTPWPCLGPARDTIINKDRDAPMERSAGSGTCVPCAARARTASSSRLMVSPSPVRCTTHWRRRWPN